MTALRRSPAVFRVMLAAAGLTHAACVLRPSPLPADLGAGDATGVVMGVVPGEGGTARALKGARISVRGSPIRVTARADGRFYLRKLPPGVHRLQVTLDANGDFTPELTAELSVEIRNTPSRPATERAYVDLGTINLRDASTIRGRVTGEGALGDVLVVVDRTDVHSGVDAVTGEFTLTGMGPGTWNVVASRDRADAGVRDISLAEEVVLAAGATTTLANPLVLSPLTDLTPQAVGAQVALPPERTQLGTDAGVGVTSLTSTTEDEISLESEGFTLMEKIGLWTLEVRPGEGFMTTVIPAIFLPTGGAALGEVLAYPEPVPDEHGCLDFDQDGQCYFGSGNAVCDVECAQAGRSMIEPCVEGGKQWDCDDDADGQADVVEQLGRDGLPPCRCKTAGSMLNPLDSTCDGDPNRADRDLDGICDMYDLFPDCRFNRAPCTP